MKLKVVNFVYYSIYIKVNFSSFFFTSRNSVSIAEGPLDPGGNDCWNEFGFDPECIVQSSAVYTFYATAGQTISYQTVIQGTYDDNPYINLSFQDDDIHEYELVSGEGDADNDNFLGVENKLFLENSLDFVHSCTCTSSPITISQFIIISFIILVICL